MQYDVYRNRNPASNKRFPYLLEVQAALLEGLDTRVVVPLAAREQFAGKILTRLMPLLQIKGKELVAVTPQMAGIAKRELGDCVGNLGLARQEIIAALDFLLTGV
ncbi:MAG: CcdB family protein [Candidatus Eremiobacterota bacterium]